VRGATNPLRESSPGLWSRQARPVGGDKDSHGQGPAYRRGEPRPEPAGGPPGVAGMLVVALDRKLVLLQTNVQVNVEGR
jgi:hypothetical protein